MRRRPWFEWHSWLGATSGLLLFVVCWSGTFATVSHELDWLVLPELRVEARSEPVDFPALHTAILERWPDARDIWISKPRGSAFAAEAFFVIGEDDWQRIYLDPNSGEVLGSYSYFNIQRFFRSLHMGLFNLWGLGIYVVSFAGLVLLGSAVTALFFYRRWWRRFTELRLGRKLRALVSDLHKLAGLWSLWFVLVIGVTGAWYLWETARADFGDGKLAWVDTGDYAVHPLTLPDASTDGGGRALPAAAMPIRQLLGRVAQERPELDVRAVWIMNDDVLYVDGQADHLLVRDRANKLYLTRDGEVLYDQSAANLPVYWRLADTADPLHFGTFAGLASQLLYFVFGLLLSGMCLTGAWLHVKRLQQAADGRLGWRGTVPSLGLTALVLGLTAVAGWQEIHAYGPIVDGVRQWPEVPLGVQIVVGGWILITLVIVAIWNALLIRSRPERPGTAAHKPARRMPGTRHGGSLPRESTPP
jgi:uncharacterized iron-regulated membrane protein